MRGMSTSEKPQIDVPVGQEPPAELLIEDLVVGGGAEATNGSAVDVHYVGVSFATATSSTQAGIAAPPSRSRWARAT